MDQLENIVCNVFNTEKNKLEKLERNTSMEWDSFNHLILISEIEKQMNISLSMKEIENIKNYQILKQIVQEKNVTPTTQK
jgi:acyl carrier protein